MHNKIMGPVIPLPVPFKANQEVDYKALYSYVTFLRREGIQTIMTTVGTSRFNLLSTQEIKKVNLTIVDAAAGEMRTIVAHPSHGALSDAISHAKYAQEIGADIFLAYFPDRYYSDDSIFEFYQAIANSVDIDIMIHEMPLQNGLGGGKIHYSIDLLTRLFEIKNITGLKEESLDPAHSEKIVKLFSKSQSIIGAGGGMSRYLKDYWLGAKTYLAGIANFYPALELEFYQAMQNEDYKKAYKIVHDIEKPFFEAIVPMGWHPCLKEALHLCGLAPSYERLPMKQINTQQAKQLKLIMQSYGWVK